MLRLFSVQMAVIFILCIELYQQLRTAATYALAVLISPKERQKKPYAIPVQLIPYLEIDQARIRQIVTDVARKMHFNPLTGEAVISRLGGVRVFKN